MATSVELPCNSDGVCMHCGIVPPEHETVVCTTCNTSWHVTCFSFVPETSAQDWHCPDCSGTPSDPLPATASVVGGLVAAVRAVEEDCSLTESEKAKKRQELVSGMACSDESKGKQIHCLEELLKCSFCMQLPDKPVTTPCGHNFCLKCFRKWIAQGKRTCANCRTNIPKSMADQPSINMTIVAATRIAKASRNASGIYRISNDQRPDTSFTTERAKKNGNANAACGKTLVTVPHDHFGPITAEYDPTRNQGVLVGEIFEDRQHCKQWGVHCNHMSGISGQSAIGAQSIALSGIYGSKGKNDDQGEWFIYSGCGGRDLSRNRRTNKKQSWDQEFTKQNQALRISCIKGYPVRVIRSWKYKGSSYSPSTGVRYDGIYRVEKCWKNVGEEGFNVCRYLFTRCDNESAPWNSDQHGDQPRPLPDIPELQTAFEITERTDSPHWGFDETSGLWKWLKPPPVRVNRKRRTKNKLPKDFSCVICKQVLTLPVTTPCAHNFCKSCFEGKVAGRSLLRERNQGGRNLRSKKNVILCPSCPTDISDLINNLQVNKELMEIIKLETEKLQNHENANKEDNNDEETNTDGEEDEGEGEDDDDNDNDVMGDDDKGGSESVFSGKDTKDNAILMLEQELHLKRKDSEPILSSSGEILKPEIDDKKQKLEVGESSNST